MPRQPGCHGSHFLGYFQEPGSRAESSSVAARLWAAITSRLPSARKIRAPTISRSVRICDPPWRRLSQRFRCPATMRGFASRIVPQLWARVLERLLLLEFGQEVGRNEPTRSPPADTARAALAKTSADSIDERPMESLSIFCKRIHEGTIRSSLPLTFSGASRRGRPRDPRNGQLPGVQRLRVPCASVDLSELPGEGSRLDPDFWSTGVLRGMDPLTENRTRLHRPLANRVG